MGKGIVRVSYDLLKHALSLPDGTIILAVRDVQDGFVIERGAFFDIKLVHPELADVHMLETIRYYNPQFRDELVDGEHYETHFVSWDIE